MPDEDRVKLMLSAVDDFIATARVVGNGKLKGVPHGTYMAMRFATLATRLYLEEEHGSEWLVDIDSAVDQLWDKFKTTYLMQIRAQKKRP